MNFKFELYSNVAKFSNFEVGTLGAERKSFAGPLCVPSVLASNENNFHVLPPNQFALYKGGRYSQ